MKTELEFAQGAIRLTRGAIARLTLNAPARRNAMSNAMWQGLSEATATIAADETIRVVILSGAEGHFCAGADISEFEAVYADAESTAAYNRLVRTAQADLRALPQPVLAEIRGACVGGGCGIALAADLRFAATEVRMGITPSRLGLAYSPEDTAQLVEKVGIVRAKDLLLSARLIGGEEALAIGLVDFLHPAERLGDEVAAYAGELAERSPVSLRATKAILNGLGAPDDARCAALRPLYEATFAGADFAEGRRAFLEKRKPVFGGS